ncbi:MAG: hypothetical protein PUB10_00665 [Clostridiales bacterium]|nr:hypothetical protein [Clostridiales bacterium]
MFSFLKKGGNPAEKEIEALVKEIQLNLENNYKDRVRADLKTAMETLDRFKESGQIDNVVYAKYRSYFEDVSVKVNGRIVY